MDGMNTVGQIVLMATGPTGERHSVLVADCEVRELRGHLVTAANTLASAVEREARIDVAAEALDQARHIAWQAASSDCQCTACRDTGFWYWAETGSMEPCEHPARAQRRP